MTYIIGWKSRGHAFLCADSAYTTFRQDIADIDALTSFGEATVSAPGLQVQESGLKLFHLGRAIVAIAGDYSTAIRILTTLRDELRHVDDIYSALATSIREVMGGANAEPVSLLLAAPGDPEPLLLAYDSTQAIDTIHRIEEPMGVCYGSLQGVAREQSRTLIGAFMTSEPSAQLHCALGVLQALGTNRNLLEQHVGGAFCGAYVNQSTINWQGDTLYLVLACSPIADPHGMRVSSAQWAKETQDVDEAQEATQPGAGRPQAA